MARRRPWLDTAVAYGPAFSADPLPMVVAFALVRKKQNGAFYQRISGRASLATR